MDEAFGRRVTTLGALADPIRRALYRFVADQPGSVSRDQAADGVDVPRHTAKFHLDRLVDEGLLVAEFRRLTGRSGPGAGRPAKVYRRSRKEVAVSLPDRRYDLAGQVLADAVERSLAGTPIAEAVDAAADAAAAQEVAASGSVAASGVTDEQPEEGQLDRVARVLSPLGYEPRQGEELVLGNCPFGRLAGDHAELVCGMNHRFVQAVARELGCVDVEAVLEPDPARCCVRVRVRRSGQG